MTMKKGGVEFNPKVGTSYLSLDEVNQMGRGDTTRHLNNQTQGELIITIRSQGSIKKKRKGKKEVRLAKES